MQQDGFDYTAVNCQCVEGLTNLLRLLQLRRPKPNKLKKGTKSQAKLKLQIFSLVQASLCEDGCVIGDRIFGLLSLD